MKKILLLLMFAATGLAAMAVTKTVGTTGADYATLKLAFDAINGGTLTSPINLQIIDNTTETACAQLTKTGVVVNVYPTVTGKTISGTLNDNLVKIIGPSNVTIDGRLHDISGTVTGSAVDLTFENTSNGTSNPSTIMIDGNSTTAITIKYCILKGSGQSDYSGVVLLKGNSTGSSYNVLSNNKITLSGTTRPKNGLYVNSTKVKIQDNNFEDVLKNNCLYVNGTFVDSEISGNSFYETASFIPANACTAINFGGFNSGFVNSVVTNNYIGGSAPQCSGTFTKADGTNYMFRAINLNTGDGRVSGITISNNTIKNFSWTNNGNSFFKAIDFAPSVSTMSTDAMNYIYNNFISDLDVSNSAGATDIRGIEVSSKNVTVYNNIISLKTNNNAKIYGIKDGLGSSYNALHIANIYNNTVYIGGTPTSGSSDSYAFQSTNNVNSRDIRNNIFYNARSNSGAANGKHYAIYLNYVTMNVAPATFTCNYNQYVATGTGAKLGYVGTGNADRADLAAIQAATGADANSVASVPAFINGSTTYSLAKDFRQATAAAGVLIAAVPSDFAGAARTTASAIGAFESNSAPLIAATSTATVVSMTVAKVSGTILSDGGASVTASGVVYGTVANPTLADSFTTDGTAEGDFTSSITGLTPHTTYYARVYATNSIGTSYGPEVTFNTIAAPSAADITGITAGNTKLTVNFTAGSDGGSPVTNFEYSTDGGNSFTACNPAVTASPVLITGLTNGTAYNVVIRAVNAIGVGANSDTISATPSTVPAAPLLGVITASDKQLSVALIVMNNGGAPVTNFKYSTDGGASYTACDPAQTTGPIVIKGLTNGTEYSIRVKAVNINGDGAESAIVKKTPMTLPSPPVLGTATPGVDKAVVEFTAGDNGGSPITNYEYSKDGGATFVAFSPAVTASPVTISGLTTGTAYNIQLRAVNSVGRSAASNTVTVTPLANALSNVLAGGIEVLPAEGGIRLTGNAQVEVFTFAGVPVFSAYVTGQTIRLAAGAYIAKVSVAGKTGAVKVLVK